MTPLDRVRAGSFGVRAGVVLLLALAGVSLYLRTRALRAGFWIDEGLSVGIGSSPMSDIPGILKLDGSPPLYYLVLHVWMEIFGRGEGATHGLSIGFALLCVPAAFWAARSLAGNRAGWYAAIIAALHPFLTFYAQETRMYSLVVLLAIIVAGAWGHVFVRRERRYIPAFSIAAVLLIFTHNWGFFLLGGTALALYWCWRETDATGRRALVRDVALGYGATALMYAIWIPTLLFQASHTGAPWSQRPGLDELLGAAVSALGGWRTAPVIAIVAGAGLAAMLGRAVPVPGAPEAVEGGNERRRVVLVSSLLTIVVGSAVLAWLASQISPAWAPRYFAAFVGPGIVLAAIGLAHAKRLGVAALILLALVWNDARVGALTAKSNVREVTARLSLRPIGSRDLVVSTHPEQVPVLRYYLGDQFRYASSMGDLDNPRVMDWRDALHKLKYTRPTPTADALIRSLRPGQALILVEPLLRPYTWRAPWTRLVKKRTLQWERVLERDHRLRRVELLPKFGLKSPPRGVRAIIYRVKAR